MKSIYCVFFILLFYNLGITQILGPADARICAQEDVLISKYPRNIKNKLDFENAIRIINAFDDAATKKYILTNKLATIILPIAETVDWANKKTDLKTQLICKKIYLAANFKTSNIPKIIEIASELILFKDYFSAVEMHHISNILHFAYMEIEAYNEVIRLMPLRKKYIIADYLIVLNNELALVYFSTKNYKLALEQFKINIENLKPDDELLQISSLHNNIGLCYQKLKNYENAKQHFKIALKFIDEQITKRKKNDYHLFFKAVINLNLAKINAENRQSQKIINAHNALIQKTKIAGEKNNITSSYLGLAKIYLTQKKIILSKKYLDSVKNSNFSLAQSQTKIDYYNTVAKLELLQGNVDASSKMFDKSSNIIDSLDQVQTQRENILATAKYKSDQKDQELSTAKTNAQIKASLAFNQSVGLIITSILLTIIAFLYFKKKQAETVILKQNNNLTINLKEKEMLLKEVHHRIKNNLQVISSLLQLQADKKNSPEIDQILHDSEQQINSIALMHQMLYQNESYAIISVAEYITKLTDQLLNSTHSENYSVTNTIDDIELSTDVVIPLGLIINELFSNSHKHAFNGKNGNITISIIQIADHVFEFKYTDDGKGIDKTKITDNFNTTGFNLLKMLAEEISGTLIINGDNGFQATIKFNDLGK